ncbi:hypothetical protein [Mailhella massiliensis]|uniref:Uncharacterized protein n=1 Tax=Mailhella massiliensis TaxID=1903261 RepID=A0A921AVU7_9BACT|nr:hypothetical protein [Mailhella massiliensis]HJD96886.1 hypothetical protein [Mailhella massiliensis]
MRIDTSAQLQQQQAAGAHFALDNRGRLETQGAVRHFFQKIADIFRSLSSSGRAAIEARNAAVSAAMDRILRQGGLPNVANTDIPRTCARPSAQKADFLKESYCLAESAVGRAFPGLDHEKKQFMAMSVNDHFRNMPDLEARFDGAESLGRAMEEYARGLEGRPSAQKADLRKESFRIAEGAVGRAFPGLDNEKKQVMIMSVNDHFRNMPDLEARFDGAESLGRAMEEYARGLEGRPSAQKAASPAPEGAGAKAASAQPQASAQKDELRKAVLPFAQNAVHRAFSHLGQGEKTQLALEVNGYFWKQPDLRQLFADKKELERGVNEYVQGLKEGRLPDWALAHPVPEEKAPEASYKVRGEDVEGRMNAMAKSVADWFFPGLDEAAHRELADGACGRIRSELLAHIRDEDGSVLKKELIQLVADTVEELARENMPDAVRTGFHPAPGVKTKASDALTPQLIRPETILTQGPNTCFMMSVVNSMLTTEKGRAILRTCITPDGLLDLGMRATGQATVKPGDFASLELSMADAYSTRDNAWSYGRMGLAGEFAQLFGMDAVPYRIEDGEEKFQGTLSGPGDLETVSRHLNNGYMVILYMDRHYMAVVGTEAGGLILRNSMGGKEEHVPLGRLVGSTIDVLSYPEV